MVTLLFQIATIAADILVFSFAIYYLLVFRKKESDLNTREGKVDTEYHQVVDSALSRERKIIEDATSEAEHIITGAQYLTTNSQQEVDQALKNIIAEIQKEALTTAQNFLNEYSTSLKDLTSTSLSDFQNVAKELEQDLQKQVQEFHGNMLPSLEKELAEYKASRLKETEQLVTKIVQKVSAEVLNKSLALSDHQSLIIDSLEKAKKEGIFD